MLEDYVKPDTVFLHLNVENRKELFTLIAADLFKKGYVKEGFLDFLTHREDNYPTGLQLASGAVAIPHGDPKFIKKPFVAVVTLEQPIVMQRMDDSNQNLPVDELFVLGLDSGTGHIELLQTIIKLIQQGSFVDQIQATKNAEQVLQVIAETEVAQK
ncbi:PTS sugar transporter subunit IIA [Lactiplantibacillus plantarum]|uniref:PTS sugar transporter subunit IIA n=1 Tax=Lactiplantibacillus plantarum TaxID=1590 RepID=UPI00209C9EA7|nr:PTS sugar transporter subunit IIA [Lactiplantibacillus plantarum]USZ60685.1 PTS sugar transporter subunit IIA [Lactiplantibacillus plantarum]